MGTVRLFTATFIDTELMDSIYEEIKVDFSNACTGKWVETENLHFTYHFLGDVDELRKEEIKGELNEYLKHYSSELIFEGLGCFPDKNNPKVLFANIANPDGAVFKIHEDMAAVLSDLGFPKDKRKYSPHLTLRRIKSFNRHEFKHILNHYQSLKIGKMSGFDVRLVQSELSKQGPVYTIL